MGATRGQYRRWGWAGMALIALLTIATLASAADRASPDAATKGEAKTPSGKADETGKDVPQYRLGLPLNGRFDLSTLRAEMRVASYRYSMAEIKLSLPVGPHRSAQARIKLVLEFGSETGMAEIRRHESAIESEIQSLIGRFDSRVLLDVSGKLQLKDALARMLNAHLRTTQVRQIYLTDFMVQL